MKITCLMDDHNVPGNLNSEHGLSLYIKMKNHHILFDTGQSAQFISNAIKLGIDLNQVNIVV
ncbi:MAG TPA: hypothetical protein VJ878_04650, partial [Candidatus Izemoplasmatales bacterium]|nr:hypothetical protein [Candidatus Izemoplasmatales bacterium]